MRKIPCLKKYSSATTLSIAASEHDYLYVKNSQIPDSGKGLFTAIPLYKDEVISIFKGIILSDEEAQYQARNGTNAYFINLPDGTIMDSMPVACFAKYANDAEGLVTTKYRNNAKISIAENGKVCILATKKISVDSEIFCSYGKRYWCK